MNATNSFRNLEHASLYPEVISSTCFNCGHSEFDTKFFNVANITISFPLGSSFRGEHEGFETSDEHGKLQCIEKALAERDRLLYRLLLKILQDLLYLKMMTLQLYLLLCIEQKGER